MRKLTKIERHSLEITGKPMTEYFDSCLTSGITLLGMTRKLKVSCSTLKMWMYRNKRQWSLNQADGRRASCRFEFMGFYGTQGEHCRHHGVSYVAVRDTMRRLGFGFTDALQKTIRGAEMRAAQKIGINEAMRLAGIPRSTVYTIKGEYKTTTLEALEIAIQRRKSREARNG